MAEHEESANALSALSSGDFKRAKELYGELLSLYPEDPEYQCGLYTSGYWDNRGEETAKQRQGRGAGEYLVREWEKYQHIADDRDYTGCLSFRMAMRVILGHAADQFRLAYQNEGSLDRDTLLELGRCLIRIEDYRNAQEILQYARKVHSPSAEIYFLLGESLCCLEGEGNHQKGMSFYRDACMLDPQKFDPAFVASQPASAVFQNLYRDGESTLESVNEWMPFYLSISSFLPGLRRLSEQELSVLSAETERLERDLSRVADKFKSKVRARLAFYCTVFLYQYIFHSPDPEMVETFEEKLEKLNQDLYTVYKEKKKAGGVR